MVKRFREIPSPQPQIHLLSPDLSPEPGPSGAPTPTPKATTGAGSVEVQVVGGPPAPVAGGNDQPLNFPDFQTGPAGRSDLAGARTELLRGLNTDLVEDPRATASPARRRH